MSTFKLLPLGAIATIAWWACSPGTCHAQVGPNGQMIPNPGSLMGGGGMMPGQMGGLNGMPGNQMATPQQLQQMMMLRAMQGMGHHHGVQTGVPNPIIGGMGPQFNPMGGGNGYSAPSTAGRRNSSEKRAAAKLAREQQKQLTRERAAEAKRTKGVTRPIGKAKGDAS
jgi:hypothetical protein